MSEFSFKKYEFDGQTAQFSYAYEDFEFTEKVEFFVSGTYSKNVLERALFLAFLVVGTSYYKAFPARTVRFEMDAIDAWQAKFCDQVYQEGLSQFAFENHLSRDDLAHFAPLTDKKPASLHYNGDGILSLQSGGKDSLLVASLLAQKGVDFTPWYVSSGDFYPKILDELGAPLVQSTRNIDRKNLALAAQNGARNGHVPVTFIVLSYALIQAILLGKNTIIAAIGHEGEEPHAMIGDLPVNHQWSKTWPAEQLFAEYVRRYVSPDIHVGSTLRKYSELKIAELFAKNTWDKFGEKFSSCNVANYQQGANNRELKWCGNCPKCANSYLLFAPFVAPKTLQSRFGGELYERLSLVQTFKGLLGIEGVMKPFECVGEINELRAAYHTSQTRGYRALPFAVPASNFDKDTEYDTQQWAADIIQV